MRHSVDRQLIDFCIEKVLQNDYGNGRKLEKCAANLFAHCADKFGVVAGFLNYLWVNFYFMACIKTIIVDFKYLHIFQ